MKSELERWEAGWRPWRDRSRVKLTKEAKAWLSTVKGREKHALKKALLAGRNP